MKEGSFNRNSTRKGTCTQWHGIKSSDVIDIDVPSATPSKGKLPSRVEMVSLWN
jgi:hypothetical protein